MKPEPDFDRPAVYRTLAGITAFILDEHHVAKFDRLYNQAKEALPAPAGPV